MEWHSSEGRFTIFDRYRGGPEQLLNEQRRGRPDVVHSFLCLALRSPLRRKGLEVMVHTRQDQVITFGPGAKVPANYLEFLKMFDPLLEVGSLGEGRERIDIRFSTFDMLVEGQKVLVLSPRGEMIDLSGSLKIKKEGWTAVIGGFTEGDFISSVYQRADEVVSLGDELLTVPLVLCRILNALG